MRLPATPRDHDAWQLDAGAVAVVKEVSEDGEHFILSGGHGQRGNESGMTRVGKCSFAEAG